MKAKKRSFLTLLLALALTVSGTVMAIAATVTADDFKVTVDTDKDSYNSGDKIYMSVAIENNAADAIITDITLEYDIPEDIQDYIVDYDKLPSSLDMFGEGTNVVFTTMAEAPETGDNNMVILLAGVLLIAAGIVIAVKTGCIRKLVSLFTVIAMLVGIEAVSNLTVQAESEMIEVEGSKNITYAGEAKNIAVKAAVTIYSTGDSNGESTDKAEANVSGTELAKLLLANERLDAEKLAEDSGIMSACNITDYMNDVRIATLSTVDASQYEDNSNMIDYFNSYIAAVESVTGSAADTITYMKENVSCTGAWIEYGAVGGDVLLKVTDNEEWLHMVSDLATFVCRRYTDSNGDDVYEICQREESDGSYAYLICTPGKRYEYSFCWSDGSDIHVIVENSRGYWNMFTTYSIEEGRNNVQNLVSANDFAYVYFGTITEDGYESNNHITFIDPTLSCDLITVHEQVMEVAVVGFNGVTSLEVDDYNMITSFTSKTGVTIEAESELADGIRCQLGNVAYTQAPYATLSFVIEEGVTNETAKAVIDALAAIGIECKYDLSAVLSGVDSSFKIAGNLGSYYNWNGYYVKDLAAVRSAVAVETARYEELMAGYEAVKDAKKIETTETGINYAAYDFAGLTLTGADAITFADGKITIEGLQAEVSVADVMADGETYEIQFALAGIGEEGEYDSAILLSTESAGAASYEGTALSLTKSAEFDVPACTGAGKYTVVAYVATSEGIRVSEMVPVTFTSEASYTNVENGYETYIELNDANEMIVYYTLMNEYEVTMPTEQDTYTYEEIYEFLSGEVLKYGYPSSSAVLEVYDTETGEAIEASAGDELSGCVCKLQYDVTNSIGMVGYVYVQLP